MIVEYEKKIPLILPKCKTNIHIECTDKNHNEWKIFSNGKILIKDCEYLTTQGNIHHYTNDFLFNVLLPLLAKKLNLFIDISKFKKIKYDNFYDFHIPINDYKCVVFSDKVKLTGLTKDILRDTKKTFLKDCPGTKTSYHTLYTFAHRCSVIINLDNNTNRVLLLNSDSMIIPLIPILSLYFDNVIVMDNRTNISKKYLYLPLIDEITDYLCILQSPNIVNKKEEKNLI